ncbi:MAG: hypothetical protein B6I24_04280 [Bacteroidetes bacterium 4572_128]|nr:MAG: hypothetical protein B6I24_04280 [Bacteroidetes bacterium 4572_128]
MKNIFFLILIIFSVNFSYAQKKLPSVEVKSLDNKVVKTSEISNDGKPIILSFWATWCKPCIKELNAINDIYEEMQEETGVKLIAISIDDSRSSNRVAPFVNARNWEYEILMDVNSNFKRAMNVQNIPHTFLIDKNKKIVWEHTSYTDGDEEELFDEVKKIAGK